MRVLGLITEYNPFHNGHKYHLLQSKEQTRSTHTIAVMSGNFLQRGEPALTNKWIRAEMAVREGVDLVLELPVIYACNSAELFAFGAISLLNKLNIVDCISFGSECGDIEKLKSIAEVLAKEPPLFQNRLKTFLSKGLPFPSAREKALKDYFDSEDISQVLNSPNNILGIEYIKSLIKINSNIKPYTIKRIGEGYHSRNIEGNICSATAIRTLFSQSSNFLDQFKNVIPQESYNILLRSINKGLCPVILSNFNAIILYKLRTTSKQSLRKVMDVKEGLENRIKNAAFKAYDYQELLELIKTKRYPLTRLQRIIIHSLLGIKQSHIMQFNASGGTQYGRVLAFSSKGAELLKRLKYESSLPILTNINKQTPNNQLVEKMLEFDICATNIYSLGYPGIHHRRGSMDFFQKPYVLL